MASPSQGTEMGSPGERADEDGRFQHMSVPPEAELTKACTMAIITGGHLMLEVGASTVDIVDEHGEVAREEPMSSSKVVANLEVMMRRSYNLSLVNIVINEDTTTGDIIDVFRSGHLAMRGGMHAPGSHKSAASNYGIYTGHECPRVQGESEHEYEEAPWRCPQMVVTLQDVDKATPLIQCSLMEAIEYKCFPGEGDSGESLQRTVNPTAL